MVMTGRIAAGEKNHSVGLFQEAGNTVNNAINDTAVLCLSKSISRPESGFQYTADMLNRAEGSTAQNAG
jgi:hypothetical protein